MSTVPSTAAEQPKRNRTGAWIAGGLLLGILCGVLFGEYCGALASIGVASLSRRLGGFRAGGRTLESLGVYWIQGGGTQQRLPRWCVLRDVLHWLP